jgi:branched-chain amino acid transport system substrate-binding protein
MPLRHRRIGLGLVVLLLAACGSQVDRSVFETAGPAGAGSSASAGTSSGSGGALTPGEAGTLDGEAGPSSDAATSPEAGAAPGADGGDAPQGASGGPAAPGDAGGGGKANHASDVGVTENAIKVGNITTVGGPMPGQFEPFLLGVRTWVNEVNERGGINGRKVDFLPCDDGMDAQRNRSCARDLIENQKVFAIVGTNTPAMPSARYINDQKVPAVGVAPIGNYVWQLPYWFSYDGMRQCPRNGVDQPGQQGYCASNTGKSGNASYKFFKESIGISKAAVFWHNIDISKQAGLDFAHILRSSGIDVAYTAETQVAEPDYTGHVLQMRDRGVEGIWDTMEVNNNIRLMQAMDRQGFEPKAKVTTVAAYGQEIGKQVNGPSRNRLFAVSTSRPYTDTGNPAVASFLKLFDRYFSGKPKHIWNVDGYRGALLFGDAVAALGADLTREGLVKWLNELQDYDPHGLGYPTDFRPFGPEVWDAPNPPKKHPWCYSVVQFKDTDWVKTPGEDFKCLDADWVEPRS